MLFSNFNELSIDEQKILTDYRYNNHKEFLANDTLQAHWKNDFEDDLFLAGRHKLDYAKLYHNQEGGYSMEELKRVLERNEQDMQDFHMEAEQDN